MNADVHAELTAHSNRALQSLVNEHGVKLRRLPDAVLHRLQAHSVDVCADVAARDAAARKIYKAYEQFRKQVAGWTEVSELAFLRARG